MFPRKRGIQNKGDKIMWEKRKKLIVATAVVGLMAVAAPALKAVAASPFGSGNPLDALQGQIDRLAYQIQELLNPPLPSILTGDYSVLGSFDCIFQPGGFAGSSTAPTLKAGAFAQHITTIGSIHFNGDGTALQTTKEMAVNIPGVGLSPTFARDHSCTYTSVSAVNTVDGTFTLSRPVCMGSLTEIQLEGRIGNGGKTLLLAGITPTVETVNFTNPDGTIPAHPHQRSCTRSSVATKIK
jgi:hypothetical protein